MSGTTNIVKSPDSDASSMLTIPPGPRFLLQHLHYIAIPPAFTLFITNVIARFLGQPVPIWAALFLAIVSFPAFFFGNLTLEEFRWRRAAAAHGATLPRIARKSDMKTTGEAEDRFPRQYLHHDLVDIPYSPRDVPSGDFLFRLCEKYGNTLLLEIFFVKRVINICPDVHHTPSS